MKILIKKVLTGVGVGAGGAVGYSAFKSPIILIGVVGVAYYYLFGRK